MDDNILFTFEGDSGEAVGSIDEIVGSLEGMEGAITSAAASAGDLDTVSEALATAATSAGDLDGVAATLSGALTDVGAQGQVATDSLAALGATADSAASSFSAFAASTTVVDEALGATTAEEDALAAAQEAATISAADLGTAMKGLITPLALITAAVVGVGVVAVHMAGDFQESMTQLVTGAGESEANLQMVSNAVLAMATQTGESTKQLAAGLYMIESAGYHGAAGLKILQAAAEGAKVGNADLGVVADATTTILNDFGNTGVTAANAVNLLIATVASGKTHMQDLATSLAMILPTASAARVGLTDVMGAMATMTGEGVPAANAATYLRQMLLALDAPSAAAQKALESVGLTTAQVAADMQRSLPDTLRMIVDAIGKKFPVGSAAYVQAIKDISGGSKTMQGMLDLTGSHLATFQQNVAGVTGAVKKGGSSITGWALASQDFNTKLAQAGATLQVLMIKVGQALMPVATAFLHNLMPALTQFSSWAGDHGQQIAQAIVAISVALGVTLVGAILAATAAWVAADVASGGILLAIGLLAVGIAYLVMNWGNITNAVFKAMPALKTVSDLLGQRLQVAMKELGKAIGVVASWLGGQLHDAATAMAPAMAQAGQAMAQFGLAIDARVMPLVRELAAFLLPLLRRIAAEWIAVWPYLQVVLSGVWQVIQGVVKAAWAVVSNTILIGLDLLSGNWKGAWTDLQNMQKGVMDGIKQATHGMVTALIGMLAGWATHALSILSVIPGPIGDMARKAQASLNGLLHATDSTLGQAATKADQHAQAIQVAVDTRLAAMHLQAAAHMEQMRQSILNALAHTTNPAKRHALEIQLALVTASEQTQVQTGHHFASLASQTATHMKRMSDTAKQHSTKMKTDVVSNARQMATQAGQQITHFVTNLGPELQSAIPIAQQALGRLGDTIRTTLHHGLDAIGGIVHHALEPAANAFKWLYDHNYYFKKLVDTIHVQLARAQVIVDGAKERITGALEGAWHTMTTDAQHAWDHFTGLITDAGSKAKTQATTMASNILAPITNLASSLYTAGQHAVQMLINGIGSMAGAVGKAAGNIASQIAKNLGFHSPTEEGPGKTADQWMPALGAMLERDLRAQAARIGQAAAAVAGALAGGIAGGRGGLPALAGAGGANTAAALTGGMGGTLAGLTAGALGGSGGGSGLGVGGGAQAQLLAQILAELRGQNSNRAQPLGAPPTSATTGAVTQQFYGGMNFSGITNLKQLYNQLNMLAGIAQENGGRGATYGLGG